MSGRWRRVTGDEAVTEDAPASVEVDGEWIGVFRVGGALYALEDVCPHAFAKLSEGWVEGEEVECLLHAALFHIPTGKCLRGPANRDLKTYEVRVEDGSVYVRV